VSDSSSLEIEKYASCSTNWWDTQECYRYHKVGYIVWYCSSTAVVESEAQMVVVAAMSTMTMTIENYWITATG